MAEKQHTKDLSNTLLNMESNNPKEFWEIINRTRTCGSETYDPADNIEASKWLHHFKTLLEMR